MTNSSTDTYGTGITLGNIGRLCMDMGDFKPAIGYLKKDLNIIRKYHPEMRILTIQLLSHIGTCYLDTGNLAKAKSHFTQSNKLAVNNNNHIGMIFAGLGLGKVALLYKNINKAKQFIEFVQKLTDEIKSKLFDKNIVTEGIFLNPSWIFQ